MILTIAYFVLAALTAIVLNPFLVVGLVIADLIALFLLVMLAAAYWQKQAVGDMSEAFDFGSEDSPWSEEDVEDFLGEN